MDSKINKIITRSAWIAIILFIIRCFMGYVDILSFLKCDTWYDYFGAAGEVIAITTVILYVYNKWGWEINPFRSAPKLKGSYTGNLIYNYNGQSKRKNIKVDIAQTSLKVSVKITTNEITSNTITSDIVEENDEYVLYYTYITNPKSKYSEQNPIQYGTCRLTQKENKTLEGIYWTSRQTKGDITLTPK